VSEQGIDRVLLLTEQLLNIPSVTGEEQAIADYLDTHLQELQPHALIRAENSFCIVPRELDAKKKTLMLVGHTDTVPKLGENPVRREGDRLYGLGASDMKAADAVILWAASRAIPQDPRHNLVAVLYAREEGAYDTSEMPAIYQAAKPHFDHTDLAICMEPTDNRIELGALGTSHAAVTFKGQRAHSARPWQGDNAIHKAAPLLARLAARDRQAHEFHGLTFYEVISATMAESRGARNIVPDQLTLNLNYRFAPGKDESHVRQTLDDLIAGEADWELIDYCPAGLVCGDNPLLQELKEAIGNPEVRAKQAWTDVGRLSRLGVDAINWGPGAPSQAHQAGEWVGIAAVREAVGVVDRWLWGEA
jgi:succinyl-diaminopimelate desuccinylase